MNRYRTGKMGFRKYNAYGVVKIRRPSKEVYTEKWPSISKAVKRRDGYRCKKCGSSKNLEVHHIIPISQGGKTVLINLITLCEKCHSRQPRHKHLR